MITFLRVFCKLKLVGYISVTHKFHNKLQYGNNE